MSAQKSYTATNTGLIQLDLELGNGQINVTVDPKTIRAEVTVRTTATPGPITDVVNATRFTESGGHLTLVVPDAMTVGGSPASTVQIGGSTFSFNSGVINTGTMTGVTVSNGDVWVGGQQVVAGGKVVAATGTTLGCGTGAITVDVTLPTGSSLKVKTGNAETLVRGDLEGLNFEARNGSLRADGVYSLDAEVHNGSVLVERVDGELEASARDGSITIGAYNGGRGSARAHNGHITISATPAASGRLTARTHNGSIRVRGASHLDLRTSTHNGQVW
ncbi:DUF4097 family beta strand repeat-containing protein [Streptomyces beijiangensis]|uniref:DUF4097 family beta strand repeat-containing protein n=1 Tax=Streptomyces beijiangensis TaxID=163361 RepID=UPI0031E33777